METTYTYRSDEINELATALSKAQGEFKPAQKTKKNFFKSEYAPFEESINAVRASLAKHGLSFIQPPISLDEKDPFLYTILLHSSGQWIESRLRISPPKNDVQALGSYLTYLKRYCLESLLGIARGDEDDDGEAAMQRDKVPQEKSAGKKTDTPSVRTEYISEDQLDELYDALDDDIELAQQVKNALDIQELKDMKKSEYRAIMNKIREVKGIKKSLD